MGNRLVFSNSDSELSLTECKEGWGGEGYDKNNCQ